MQVQFKSWTNTDRSQLLSVTMQTDEFADFLFGLLSKLKTHDWTNKQQQEALRKRKQDLQEGDVILAGDFSENYSSLIQVHIIPDICHFFSTYTILG